MSEIRIIGPDGQRFVFPAGTDPEVMKSAMRRRYTGETRRTTDMIRNTQLPDERMQGARDYLARDQLRQDMEAGRQARRTEEATGPENIAKERFYTGAQGRTLGAAPLLQGAINIPISAMMYPFLTQEQKAGRSFDEFVSDMSSVGYDQARGSIDRAREKRPLESAGLEIAGGFLAGKTLYDDLGNRFLASQPGARGALVGAGSGAQYEFLESEGDPASAARGALIGAPVGAGVSKAIEAAAEPLGRLFRGEVPMPKLGPEATNAAYGAGLGGIAPADSAEERARNMAVGAGIGLAPGVINRVRGAGAPRAMPDTMPAGAGDNPYFGRQSMRPPGSGPSPREIETQQQWAKATPIVTQARTTALSAQQAADAALQSKAPADIARAKDQKKALVGQIKEAQASRAGMDTPEDARLAETLASLTENTSDPVLLSTQISAAKTSLDRLLTDIGSPSEGNLIPVKTNILTRTQAPRSAAEGPQDRASVTRYAEGADEIKPQGFGAGGPKVNPETLRSAKSEGFDTSRVLYRGMREPLSPDGLYATTTPGYETQGLGVSLSTSAKAAAEYGENVYPVVVKGKFFSEKEYVNRINKLYETQGIGPRDAAVKVRAELAAEGYAGLKADGGKLLDKGELRVWGDDSGLVPNVKVVAEGPQDRASVTRYAEGSDDVQPMGFGAGTPKTPEQAVRFETPGSPEYEAAVAKGLDMSQAGRMGRAKEMGFDTETVLYHGTNEDVKGFDLSFVGSAFGTPEERGIFLTNNAEVANLFSYKNDGGNVLPLYVRGKIKTLTAKDLPKLAIRGRPEIMFPSRKEFAKVIKKAKAQGFDGVRIKNVEEDSLTSFNSFVGDQIIIFDPSNIRSVNAAFDPKKSGSSTLLAAAPFAAVGGVGAGTAMGEDD